MSSTQSSVCESIYVNKFDFKILCILLAVKLDM